MGNFAVKLESGRVIDCVEDGDPHGFPLFVLHGTPGSRLLFKPQVIHASENGIRLVSYSRPGYGHSTRNEGRRIADCAPDVRELADFLGLDRFAVMGFSGGGPHALACGALLPDRVTGAVSVAGTAPYGAEGIDFMAGMGEYNIEDFNLLMGDQKKWEENNRKDIEMMRDRGREGMYEVLETLMSEPDRKAVSDDLRDFLYGQFIEGCEPDIYGLKDDNLAFLGPWGFDPSSIHVLVQIWQGSEDRFVPFSHGKWLAENIRNSEPHLVEGQGHLSLFVSAIPEIHGWVSRRF